MNFDEMIRDIAKMGLNLYDFALYTPAGIQSHRFQPSNRCNNSYSVAKAFVVTAIGLLWEDGRLDVGDSIYDLFRDEFPSGADPAWRLATVEHAITHSLGFDQGFLDIDVEDITQYESDDFLYLVLSHPLKYAPGTHRQYSDAAYYLLSRVVSRAAGENVDTLLYRRLFQPMRFREAAWSRCPRNYPIGATGLYISSEDMVKLGALYLNGGVWQGKRLISRDWVDKVLERGYELRAISPNGLIGKGGMYGQGLVLQREKGFAAAWHGFNTDGVKALTDYLDAIE